MREKKAREVRPVVAKELIHQSQLANTFLRPCLPYFRWVLDNHPGPTPITLSRTLGFVAAPKRRINSGEKRTMNHLGHIP